jgi:uncharacterized protein (DUF1800 family)
MISMIRMSRINTKSRTPGSLIPTTSRLPKWLAGAFALALLAGLLAVFAPHFASAEPQKQKNERQSFALKGLPASELSEDQAIVHALNRLGYGPRPGDVEHVKQIGLAAWIDQQLHPESINDSALGARLAKFPTLTMSSSKLLADFPRPQQAARRAGMTVEEYRKEQQAKLGALQQGIDAPANSAPAEPGGQNNPQAGPQAAPPALGTSQTAPPEPPLNPENYAGFKLPQRVVAELAMAKLDRAVYSERQLYEQMVDFWFNHFNVFAGKGADLWLLTSYERDAIRPHAMGKFRDLLEATAKSPAMLFYLDNWQSADPEAAARLQAQQQQRRFQPPLGPFGVPRRFPPPARNPNTPPKQQAKQTRGLNENYGRELMELHTLGVDGGYTQQDVIEVARAFTGWTMRAPQRDPEFFFDERIHDPKPKMVLGHKIDAGGMRDGEEVLDLLVRDPHTAHHISFQIAQHFVADNPPDALVDRMAATFQATEGDIRAVLHTMIYSPEFWSRDTYRDKIKTPFELVASAARAVSAEADVPLLMVQWTNRIGEPLYQCIPPTGYSDKADAWVNTGALLNRMNYALALTSNRLRGVRTDVAVVLGTAADSAPSEVLNRAIDVLLSGEASPETRSVLQKRMSDPQVLQASLDDPVREINAGVVAGLVLGAPEFQRR